LKSLIKTGFKIADYTWELTELQIYYLSVFDSKESVSDTGTGLTLTPDTNLDEFIEKLDGHLGGANV
jgi:hypothetical protein